MEQKICSKCNRILDIDNFYVDRKNKGYQGYCKKCSREYRMFNYYKNKKG